MKRNECGTEEDLLPYYALFGLPRKLRTLEKTLESIPKAGRRIPGWATFVGTGNGLTCPIRAVPALPVGWGVRPHRAGGLVPPAGTGHRIPL